MQYEFPDLIKATYLAKNQRYLSECQINSSPISEKMITTTLFGLSALSEPGVSVFISKRESFHRVPYLLEWVSVSDDHFIFANLAKAVPIMLDVLIKDKNQDFHDLCIFKLEQLPPVFCQNDLRLELMTRHFQPHLVLIYPVMKSDQGSKFFFGAQEDSWLFDPLIDALSYRRAGHKATLIFYILDTKVETIHLMSEQEGDTVKILKEGIRSGINIVTPKICAEDPFKMELSFTDRFCLS